MSDRTIIVRTTVHARFQPPATTEPDLTNVTAWVDMSVRDIRDAVCLYDCRVKIRGTGGTDYTVERIEVDAGAMWRQLDERHPFDRALAAEIEIMVADLAERALVDAYWEG